MSHKEDRRFRASSTISMPIADHIHLRPQSNKRLERNRHERAFLLSNLAEPLKRSVRLLYCVRLKHENCGLVLANFFDVCPAISRSKFNHEVPD